MRSIKSLSLLDFVCNARRGRCSEYCPAILFLRMIRNRNEHNSNVTVVKRRWTYRPEPYGRVQVHCLQIEANCDGQEKHCSNLRKYLHGCSFSTQTERLLMLWQSTWTKVCTDMGTGFSAFPNKVEKRETNTLVIHIYQFKWVVKPCFLQMRT